MYSKSELFSFSHSIIFSVIIISGILLSLIIRKHPILKRKVHLLLATILIIDKCSSFIYNLHAGILPPHGLPLQLSDMTIFIVVITLIAEKQWSFELSYYWGFSGAVLALLTPDLKYEFPSLPALLYFGSHGIVVISVMIFVLGEFRKPERRSFLKAFLLINAYSVLMSIFDYLFKTDYFYLVHKPERLTLLNYLGPWPFYIIFADIIAFIFFWLLSLPFRKYFYS